MEVAYCVKKLDFDLEAAYASAKSDDSSCSSDEDFELKDKLKTKKRHKKAAYEKLERDEKAASGKEELQEAVSDKQAEIQARKNFCSKSPYKCVRQNKSGTWSSRIRDPLTKTRIWLGSFKSAEDAYEAYCAKKQEIDKKTTSKEKTEAVFYTDGDKEHDEVKITKRPKKRRIVSKSPYKCVYLRKSGKWTTEIKDPITKARYWLGTFTSAEEAYSVYRAKKLELEKTGTIRMEKKRRSSDEAAYGAYCAKKLEIEEKEAAFASESVPVSSPCSVLKDSKHLSVLTIEMASLVVDENGFLLGEFSKIDDLSICEDGG